MNTAHEQSEASAASALASSGGDTVRAYEDAATAIGRLDATAQLAEPGFRELLVLRCIATGAGISHQGMIALAVADGEGGQASAAGGQFAGALRQGAARARGGALPSVESLHELLQLAPPAPPVQAIDDLLRDAHARTPPVLKAALVAQALRAPSSRDADGPARSSLTDEQLAALAVTLVLCVGGATTDAWLTLPKVTGVRTDLSLRELFTALAREARATERALLTARDLADVDEHRVRDTLGRAAYSALEVLAFVRERIVISVPQASRALGLTAPTAGAAVARLVELGILREATGKARSRVFAYDGIVRSLSP